MRAEPHMALFAIDTLAAAWAFHGYILTVSVGLGADPIYSIAFGQTYKGDTPGYSSSICMPGELPSVLPSKFGLWCTLHPAVSACSVILDTQVNGGANDSTLPSGWYVAVCAPMTTQSNIDRST